MGILLLVTPPATDVNGEFLSSLFTDIIAASARASTWTWSGNPSKSQGSYYKWDIVESITQITRKSRIPSNKITKTVDFLSAPQEWYSSNIPSGEVIRYRRSPAATCNSLTSSAPQLRKKDFFGILGIPCLGPSTNTGQQKLSPH